MQTKLSDQISVLTSAASADITAALNTAFVAAAAYRRFMASVDIGAVAQTKTVTIQLRQATDNSGTGAKNLGTATVLTAPTGGWTQKSAAVDAQINDLDDANGFDFISVQIVSNNATAVPGGVTLIAGDARFNPYP